ncbi:MAG: histidine kinase dimerization/phosphoacceptor domain -containing protein [Ignavibacteria bacterium]|nr:histidine kinase dimerization/phosphoacceptor domain -containing protein [Ignavibacteria bacterium]
MLKIRVKHLLALLLLIFVSSVLKPQSFNTQFYNESNGLANSKVWTILQDKSGRIWFGTRSGISVYDGLSWKGFLNTDGISGYECFALHEDKQGSIKALFKNPSFLVATYNGSSWKTLPPSGFVTASLLSSFLVSGTGDNEKFYIITQNEGISYYANNAWTHVDFKNDFGIAYIYSGCVAADSILLATDKGLFFLNEDNKLHEYIVTLPSMPRGVYTDTKYENKVFLAGDSWFGYIENGVFNLVTKKVYADFDYNIVNINIQPDNHSGFYLYNNFTVNYVSLKDTIVTRLNSKSGLVTNGASCVFVDGENNIWIGSLRGVNKISSRRFVNFLDLFREGDGEVSAILEYEPGKIIFGGNSGYTLFDGTTYRYYNTAKDTYPATEKERILDMALDSKGNIWIASITKGFLVVDRNGKVTDFGKIHGLNERVVSVAMDSEKNMWLTTNESIYSYDGKKLTKHVIAEKNSVIRKVFALDDSTMAFVTVMEGLFLRTKNSTKHIASLNKETNSVYAVKKDTKGTTWIGTMDGLYVLKNDSLQRAVLNNNETINRPVYLVLEDKSGNVWFGTDFGVYKYNGKTLRGYSTKEGLAGNELNRAGGIVEKNGRIWFGTNFGASCYYEEYDENNANTDFTTLRIKEFSSEGQIYPADKDVSLSSKNDNITFYVSGCSFINEKENKISWMLEGADNEWKKEIIYQTGEISYDNLAPGEYKLYVRMRNADGVLGPATASGVITIEKPLYLKWWFLLFSAFVLFGIVYSGVNYFSQFKYTRFLKAEVAKVTEELKETEDKHREALLKEIHHRIKNNLQIVSSLLSLQSNTIKDPEVLEIMRESQNRIRSMALIHEKLYQSKRYSTIDISSYIKGLVDYLIRAYTVNTALIKVKTDIPELFLNVDISISCGLIINELVSNALKYAFQDKPAGSILIIIKKEDDNLLCITVSDNGKGFEGNHDFENSETLGLRLVNMLVRQHQGTMNVTHGGGAVFTIKLRLD